MDSTGRKTWWRALDGYTCGVFRPFFNKFEPQLAPQQADAVLAEHGKKVCYIEVLMTKTSYNHRPYGQRRMFQGSGVIVQEDLVLTNAHLFFSPEAEEGMTKMKDDWKMEMTVSMSPSTMESIPAEIVALGVKTDITKPIPPTTVCTASQDLALVKLSRPFPTGNCLPITPQKRKKAAIRHQSIAVIGIAGPPTPRHMLRYPQRASTFNEPTNPMDTNERAENVHPMHKSISLGQTSRYVRNVGDVYQKGIKGKLVRDKSGGILIYDVGTMNGQSGGLVMRGGRDVGIHRSALEEEMMTDGLMDNSENGGEGEGEEDNNRSANAGIPFDGDTVAKWLREELLPRITDVERRKVWEGVVGIS